MHHFIGTPLKTGMDNFRSFTWFTDRGDELRLSVLILRVSDFISVGDILSIRLEFDQVRDQMIGRNG